ncbi:PilW family protein [uncultured Aquabacterium sp.]|uniref:PilW family protein n=1 Tax=Aquabacterium sp. TaxID=1872578 RepID=UPI0025D181C0|nr:PilW family protein [uncultured Aquabacterium sp.]
MSSPDRPTLPPTRLTRRRPASGFTLVELMVAVAIGLLVVSAGIGVFVNLKATYRSQDSQAQLQEAQRMAVQMVRTVVQAAGYYIDPARNARVDALPAVAATGAVPRFSAGQAVAGKAGSGATGDTLYVRFQTLSGDGLFNCKGDTNTGPAGTARLYLNTLSVNASNELVCEVDDGAAAQPILGNVRSMAVLYGVHEGAATFDVARNVSRYKTAAQMSDDEWLRVLTVRIELTFVDGQRTWVQVINLANFV